MRYFFQILNANIRLSCIDETVETNDSHLYLHITQSSPVFCLFFKFLPISLIYCFRENRCKTVKLAAHKNNLNPQSQIYFLSFFRLFSADTYAGPCLGVNIFFKTESLSFGFDPMICSCLHLYEN